MCNSWDLLCMILHLRINRIFMSGDSLFKNGLLHEQYMSPLYVTEGRINPSF